MSAEPAIDFFARNTDAFRADLEALCRIPSVSANAPDEVRRSANAVADLLRGYGVENVQLLESPNAHPSVYGDWIRDASAPTLLIYGHHDVQPPGRIEAWRTDPFVPVERDGRLYARGASDDKGGVMAHLAAVRSWLASSGSLPCNIKIFIEGEEEIGSPHLGDFLTRYRDLLAADVVVLNDTPNWTTGTPALTYRLRGMVQVEVEVRVLDQPIHSGRGGGLVPDPVAILCELIAKLEGLDFLDRDVEPPSTRERENFARLGFDERGFRDSYGVKVGLLRDKRFEPLEQTWARPAMTVIGFDAASVNGSFNQILDVARARLSIRTVPNLDSRAAGEEVVRRLASRPGVTARVIASSPWWRIEPEGAAFDAARRALARGYGREPVMIGSGGSIAFIRSFADAFEGVPLILMGVEDPPCNAHSENESLHLGDWESCARSAIYLYEELHA
jgi:acetylornithine deacetylase/succinyl-diaminopimelate desuccinylase-like protein